MKRPKAIWSAEILNHTAAGQTRDGQAFHDTVPLVFHIDRSDIYRHINTAVYMNQAQDYLALLYHKVGGDAGRLRFREITIYFRKPFRTGTGGGGGVGPR